MTKLFVFLCCVTFSEFSTFAIELHTRLNLCRYCPVRRTVTCGGGTQYQQFLVSQRRYSLSAMFKISQKCQIAPRQMRCSRSECTKTCFRPGLCSEPRLGWGSFECSSDSGLYWQHLRFFCYKLISGWAAVELLADRTTNGRAYGSLWCVIDLSSVVCTQWRSKALSVPGSTVSWGPQLQGLKVWGRRQRAECVCMLVNVWLSIIIIITRCVYVGWWMCDCRTLTLSAVYMSSFNTHCRPSFNVHIMWADIHCVSKYRPSVTFSNKSNNPCSISTNFRANNRQSAINQHLTAFVLCEKY